MLKDVVTYGVFGAITFTMLCGFVLAGDASLLPQNILPWARSAYHFIASPFGPPPRGFEADLIPQGLLHATLISALIGFVVHLIKP